MVEPDQRVATPEALQLSQERLAGLVGALRALLGLEKTPGVSAVRGVA
jgi:hypothetical protein